MVIKGKAPVDSECVQLLRKAHVYYEGKDVWDCMLNQVWCIMKDRMSRIVC